MSVVTAVRKDKHIAIASDGQTTFGSTVVNGNHLKQPSKLYEIGDSIFGLVGWQAIFSIIEHLIHTRQEIFKLHSSLDIYTTLLELQKILKDEYFIEVSDDEEDQPTESNHITGLIINRTGLYKIDTYREVYEFNDFWAIGSGFRYALGAMHALYQTERTAEEIARAGIEAGIEYNTSCGLPVFCKVINI